jgi:Neutral/alkaline non-lysosomal ceramidase, N-terminal
MRTTGVPFLLPAADMHVRLEQPTSNRQAVGGALADAGYVQGRSLHWAGADGWGPCWCRAAAGGAEDGDFDPAFVAGFGQANVGDTSPNILGAFCQDTGGCLSDMIRFAPCQSIILLQAYCCHRDAALGPLMALLQQSDVHCSGRNEALVTWRWLVPDVWICNEQLVHKSISCPSEQLWSCCRSAG